MSAGDAVPPPGRAHRPARRRPRRPARRPARRPVRQRGRRRARPRGSSAGSRSGSPTGSASVTRRGRGLRRGASSAQPALAGVDAARRASATTRGSPDGWCGRCSTVLDACLDEPWAATLAAHLGHGRTGDGGRAATRPSLVGRAPAGRACSRRTPRSGRSWSTDWREGRDTDGAGRRARRRPGAGSPSSGAALVAEVGAPPPDVRHAETVARLRAGDAGLDLPGRLSLFGHTRLPVTEVELLAALGRPPRRPPLAAAALAARCGTRCAAPRRARRRADDDSADRGSATRCWPRWAATPASCSARLARVAPSTAPAGRRRGRARHLLGWLQADLRANRAPAAERGPGARRRRPQSCRSTPATARPARSTCCARCWSGCSQDDPTLEPRDILVMCPDIETYAPLIAAGFGLGEVVDGGHPAHRLRVRLADRALSRTNPLLAVAARLVELAGGRVTASRGARPGRRRRRSAAASASTTTTSSGSPPGCGEAGIRWGLDAGAPGGRSACSGSATTPGGPASTGCCSASAMSGDDHAPRRPRRCRSTTSAAATSTSPAGSPSCVHRLGAVPRPRSTGSRPLADWVGGAARRRRRRSTDVDRRADAGRSAQLERELARAARRRRRRATEPTLRLPDVRALLADRLGGPPDPRQLPHRHAHRLHDGADALGAPPGRLPGRPRRRRLPAGRRGRRRRRARPRPADRRARRPQRGPPAAARRRAGRAPRRSWSPTPAPTSTPGSRARRPCRSASCSTPLDRTTAGRRSATGSSYATRSSPTTPATCARAARRAAARSPSTAAALAGARAASPAAPPGAAVPGRPLPARAAGDVNLADLRDFFAPPGHGLPAPPARRGAAARGRRGPRRDPGRPRRAGAVGDRRPAPRATCCAGSTRRPALTAGAAPRHPAARPARRRMRCRTVRRRGPCALSPRPPTLRAGHAAQPSTSTSTSGTAAG